jgi:hypothetical protein
VLWLQVSQLLGGQPLRLSLKGLDYMGDDPSDIHVLYLKVKYKSNVPSAPWGSTGSTAHIPSAHVTNIECCLALHGGWPHINVLYLKVKIAELLQCQRQHSTCHKIWLPQLPGAVLAVQHMSTSPLFAMSLRIDRQAPALM